MLLLLQTLLLLLLLYALLLLLLLYALLLLLLLYALLLLLLYALLLLLLYALLLLLLLLLLTLLLQALLLLLLLLLRLLGRDFVYPQVRVNRRTCDNAPPGFHRVGSEDIIGGGCGPAGHCCDAEDGGNDDSDTQTSVQHDVLSLWSRLHRTRA